MNRTLLLIDPQNDFCDLPEDWCPQDPLSGGLTRPALPVAGSHADLLRVAGLIQQARFNDIVITLDTHQRIDIAHPGFWRTAEGEVPAPFTMVTRADVEAGQLAPRDPGLRGYVLDYLAQLARQGRYTHMIWPEHCVLGSWGHGIHAAVAAACRSWEDRTGRNVARVQKGFNPRTEHYSAVAAEVPDPEDDETGVNRALVARLAKADDIVVAGEAGSHCVRATVEHLVAELGGNADKLVLLTDCMSPVTGFDEPYQLFLDAMRARGIRTISASQWLAQAE
ncbi:hypothetical protein ACTSKR_07015 [Chitinibacteraceae bacterium HSL-7]